MYKWLAARSSRTTSRTLEGKTPVSSSLLLHLRHDWPLAAAVIVLATLLAYTLLSGAVPTNQGRILRSREPAAYWRWLRWLSVLLLVAVAVLTGSFLLGA